MKVDSLRKHRHFPKSVVFCFFSVAVPIAAGVPVALKPVPGLPTNNINKKPHRRSDEVSCRIMRNDSTTCIMRDDSTIHAPCRNHYLYMKRLILRLGVFSNSCSRISTSEIWLYCGRCLLMFLMAEVMSVLMSLSAYSGVFSSS